MNYKQKIFYCIVFTFGVTLTLLLAGCAKVSEDNSVTETQIANFEPKPEIIPQVESAETPAYLNLKKQIQAAEDELTKIKTKRTKILEEFRAESVEGIKISAQLDAAERQLNRLKSSANREAAKFGRKPEYVITSESLAF